MFGGRAYEVREELGFGANYGVYPADADEPLLHTAKERLAIKEDFRFSEPESGEEVLWVKAESVLDVAAAYDVIDERTGEYVGGIQRNVRSALKHSYTVRDHSGEEIATIREDSWPKAVVRRKLTAALPFDYHIEGPDGERFGTISEGVGFRDRYNIELEPADADDDEDPDGNATKFDPRLAVVSIVVIDAIEEL